MVQISVEPGDIRNLLGGGGRVSLPPWHPAYQQQSNDHNLKASSSSPVLSVMSKGFGGRRHHKIMSPEEVAAGKKSSWVELEITGPVRNLSQELWKFKHLTALFLNGNQLQRVPAEISTLNNLQVLDLSHNKLRSLPAELGDMVSLLHLYLNYNLLRVFPYELGKLFRLQTLGLHGNPLSSEISRIYNESNGTQKLLQFLLDHLASTSAITQDEAYWIKQSSAATARKYQQQIVSTSPPPQRQWISCEKSRGDAAFSVLCYNVLCDKYASPNLYSYCPTWALCWDYRKKAILEEIKSGDADIVTLQEVETEQYMQLFAPQLRLLGYSGIFSPKSRAKTMMDEERKKVDGCAIFWKNDKFSLEKEQLIEFTNIAIAKAEGSEQMLNRVMTRDNIALAAVLKVKEGIYGDGAIPGTSSSVVGEPLIVCTAHIHWDPEFCDVKLVQAMMLVQELTKILQNASDQWNSWDQRSLDSELTPPEVPFLICGDLNSLPDSGVFEFLSKGRISTNHVDFKEFRGDPVLQKVSSNLMEDKDFFSHSLRVESAYNLDIMPFTNFTFDFKGIIDYVFASENCLTKLGILGPLDPQWFVDNKILGCPHPHVPSDHLPLLVQYELLPRNQRFFKKDKVNNGHPDSPF